MAEIKRASYSPFFKGVINDVVTVPVGDGKRLLFLSGVADQDPDEEPFHAKVFNHGNAEAQARGVWKRIDVILREQGATWQISSR